MKRLWILAATAMLLVVSSCDGGARSESKPFSGSAGVEDGSTPPQSGQADALPQEETRKIIVDSTMQLEVSNLRATYLEAARLARFFGGYVAESSIDDTDSDRDTARVRLRVPASRHDELVEALRSLGGGRVLNESTTATEVTAQYTDLQSRLRNYRSSEAQYQQLLAQARTVEEVLKVQTRLDELRGKIEEAQGRLNLLANQVDFATVTLTLALPGAPAGTKLAGPAEVFNQAWETAVVVARVLLNFAVILLVALIWLAIPALLALVGWRYSRRWRAKLKPPAPPRA